MPLIPVSPISYAHLEIPGGWQARVPEIEVVRGDPRFSEIVVAFQRYGNRPGEAEKLAREALVDVFTQRWMSSLRAFVGRAALRHTNSGAPLATFRPEIAQRAFVPGLDAVTEPGKGNLLLREVLEEMRA